MPFKHDSYLLKQKFVILLTPIIFFSLLASNSINELNYKAITSCFKQSDYQKTKTRYLLKLKPNIDQQPELKNLLIAI